MKLRDLAENARFRLPQAVNIETEFTRKELTKGRWTFSDIVRAEFVNGDGETQQQVFSADLEILPIP